MQPSVTRIQLLITRYVLEDPDEALVFCDQTNKVFRGMVPFHFDSLIGSRPPVSCIEMISETPFEPIFADEIRGLLALAVAVHFEPSRLIVDT